MQNFGPDLARGPIPSISIFFWYFFTHQNAKNRIFWEGFEQIFENRPGSGPADGLAGRPVFFNLFDFFFHPKLLGMGPQGPGGPWGHIFRYFPLFLGPWASPPIFIILGCFPIRWLSAAILP